MKDLQLTLLYNPKKIKSFLHTNGHIYSTMEKTAIQVYYKDKEERIISRIEFWEKLSDGRMMKIVGYRSRSIICTYTEA